MTQVAAALFLPQTHPLSINLMHLFRSKTQKNPSTGKYTTENLFVGSPEAEAEQLANARLKFHEVFEDYLGVIEALNDARFIVTGRKGAGKSAIAEHLMQSAGSVGTENSMAMLVRQTDINFEAILQHSQQSDTTLEAQTLIEWLVLVRFTEALCKNQALASHTAIRDLEKFFHRNRGLVALDALEMKSFMHSEKAEVSVGIFSRAILGILGRRIEFKGERAPFFKLIPHLRDTLFSLLKSKEVKENEAEYLILFDDLDVGLRRDDENAMKRLGALLRLCKDYNNDFGKQQLSAKIVVLLRDDIADELSRSDADLGKLLQSYVVKLAWYGNRVFGTDENNSAIKRFIARRISASLALPSAPLDVRLAWDTVVYKDDYWGDRSSFKYVLDHTLYRPRDLILFFSGIDQLNFSLPLNKQEIDDVLVKNYAKKLVIEWTNELLFAMSKADCAELLKALSNMVSQNVRSFSRFEFERRVKGRISIDPTMALSKLFEYSLIGEIDGQSRLYFTHRQDSESPLQFNPDAQFTFQRAFLAYGNSQTSGN